VILSIIGYANAIGTEIKRDEDSKQMVGASLDYLVADFTMPGDGWPERRGTMYYDHYLKERRELETLTDHDMTRGGMQEAEFSNGQAYAEHRARLLARPDAYEKVCTTCRKSKLVTKFRRHGGSECIACKSKRARKRASVKRRGE
jgi:hypothetical protein